MNLNKNTYAGLKVRYICDLNKSLFSEAFKSQKIVVISSDKVISQVRR